MVSERSVSGVEGSLHVNKKILRLRSEPQKTSGKNHTD